MNNKARQQKAIVSLFLVWSFLIGCLPANGQDLTVSDITGNASVFVFRVSRKAPPKKLFIANVKPRRTKQQRVETVKKVARQAVIIAKIVPRRTRTKSVDPVKLPQVEKQSKEEAASVFAGVGEYYIDKEKADDAIYYFREAAILDVKNKNVPTGLSEALALKGNQLLTEEKAEKAKGFFEEAIKYNPKNALAYFGLGEVLDDLNKEDEAIASYEKALSLDKDLTEVYIPLGVIYYQKGEIAKADENLGIAIKSLPGDPQAQYFLGLVRYAQNRNEEALAAFRETAKADQESAEAHYYAGKALIRLNKNKEAIAEFEEALRLKPRYFEALFDAGAAYYEIENYQESVNKYKEAVRLKNDSAEAHANLGDAYRLMGNFNDSESSYNLAILFMERNKSFSPDEAAQIYSYVGYVIGRQCEENMKKAIPCRWNTTVKNLEKAVELSPNAADYTNLGWAYYNAGKLDIIQKNEAGKAKLEQAKLALQKSIALGPQYIEAPLLNLGVTLIDLNDYAGAISALTQVTAKRPDWNFANYALGVSYRLSGDLNSAIKEFRKALEKEPGYIAALAALGESEFRNNNRKEAERIVGKLRELNAPGEARRLEIIIKGFKLGS